MSPCVANNFNSRIHKHMHTHNSCTHKTVYTLSSFIIFRLTNARVEKSLATISISQIVITSRALSNLHVQRALRFLNFTATDNVNGWRRYDNPPIDFSPRSAVAPNYKRWVWVVQQYIMYYTVRWNICVCIPCCRCRASLCLGLGSDMYTTRTILYYSNSMYSCRVRGLSMTPKRTYVYTYKETQTRTPWV